MYKLIPGIYVREVDVCIFAQGKLLENYSVTLPKTFTLEEWEALSEEEKNDLLKRPSETSHGP